MATTTEAFLEALGKSEIIAPQLFAELEPQLRSETNPLAAAGRLVKQGCITDWQAKFLLTGRHRLRLGPYLLLDRLRRCELGDRFLAIHEQLDRKVQLQILPAVISQQPDRLQRFLQQAQQASTIDHPNLVHIYDIDQEGGRYYLVMEHVEGSTLDQLKRRELGRDDIATAVFRALQAVRTAHQKGLVHGNLVGSYVLRAENGEILVCDLSLVSLIRQMEDDVGEGQSTSLALRPIDDITALGKLGLTLISDHAVATRQVEDKQLIDLFRLMANFNVEEPKEVQRLSDSVEGWLLQNCPERLGSPSEVQQAMDAESLDESSLLTPLPAQAEPKAVAMPAQKRSRPAVLPLALLAGASLLLAAVAVAVLIVNLVNRQPGSDERTSDVQPAAQNSEVQPPKNDARDSRSQAAGRAPRPENPAGAKSWNKVSPAEDTVADTPPGINAARKADPPRSMTPDSRVEASGTDDPFAVPPTARAGGTVAGEAAGVPAAADSNSVLPPPFAQLESAIELAELGPGATSEQPLGAVFTGPGHLLGAELVSGESVAKSRIEFQMERDDQADRQQWAIRLKPTAQADAVEIARLAYADDRLTFRWTDIAVQQADANYLRNCLLRLETRGVVQLLPLRKPVVGEVLSVSEKRPTLRLSMQLPYLPDPDSLIIEIPKLAEDQFPEHYVIPETGQLAGKESALAIHLHKDPQYQFVWLRLDSEIGSRIRLSAALQTLVGSEVKAFRQKVFDAQVQALAQTVELTASEILVMEAYQAPDGQKMSHRDAIKRKKELHEQLNKQLEEIKIIAQSIPEVFDKPIPYRVYFQLGEHQVDLMVSGASDASGSAEIADRQRP